jgi:hypothetical protein
VSDRCGGISTTDHSDDVEGVNIIGIVIAEMIGASRLKILGTLWVNT